MTQFQTGKEIEQQQQTIIQTAQNLYGDLPAGSYWIYGSMYRPMSAVWVRIPGAHFVNADKAKTNMHTWVVVPAPIDDKMIADYELTPAPVFGPIVVGSVPIEQIDEHCTCKACVADQQSQHSETQETVYLLDGSRSLYAVTNQHYSEMHRCNIGVTLVQEQCIPVRCIGAWTWQEVQL